LLKSLLEMFKTLLKTSPKLLKTHLPLLKTLLKTFLQPAVLQWYQQFVQVFNRVFNISLLKQLLCVLKLESLLKRIRGLFQKEERLL